MIAPGIWLYLIFLVLLILNVPIAICLGLSGIVMIVISKLGIQVLPTILFASIAKPSLVAIPFFILAGIIFYRIGIAEKLIRLIQLLVGPIPGGLAIVSVLSALVLGANTGSGPAETAALGSVLIPGLTDAGYPKDFVTALIAASSGLAIIIPPSIGFIIYGAITGTSISKLFIAGILPGLIIGASLIGMIFYVSARRGYGGDPFGSPQEVWYALKDAMWALLAPVIILGGIYWGIFTPTEAAAVAVVYGFFVGAVIYRTLTLRMLYRILREAAVTNAVVMLLVALAGLFGWANVTLGIIEKVSLFLITTITNGPLLLFMIAVGLLVAGTVMDPVTLYFITLPILMPVVARMQWDPIWFGVVVTVALAIGQVTPPVAVNLYVACQIADLSIEEVSVEAFRFAFAAFLGLLIILYFPILSIWLPSFMR
ncbi:MAG: TRAP transporter large permease [bacterium]